MIAPRRSINFVVKRVFDDVLDKQHEQLDTVASRGSAEP